MSGGQVTGNAVGTRHHDSAPPAVGDRWLLVLLAVAYTTFVVYGSLVPLEYRFVPLERAVARFREIPYLQLGIRSRADWVANILLFVPLAFLWLGALTHRRGRAASLLGLAVVLVAATSFSSLIEFVQIYFPQRTVSLNDIVAESIGAGVGVALWLTAGPAIWGWLMEWRRERGLRENWQRLLLLYLVVVFTYNVLPLDLTISAVEIYHKWTSGLIRLVPFSQGYSNPTEMVYALITDAAIWVPVAGAYVALGRRSPAAAVVRTVAIAAVLEVLQLFVFTRYTDTTDILTAAVGAVAGATLGRLWTARRTGGQEVPLTGAHGLPRGLLLRIAGYGLWIAVLILVFWYPYDFTTERSLLIGKWQGFFSVPFRTYYYTSEFRAITELLRKTVFFLPLGVAVSVMIPPRGPLSGAVPRVLTSLRLILIAIPAAAIELGQILLPTHTANATDLALEILGALAGLAIARRVLPGQVPPGPAASEHTRPEHAPRARGGRVTRPDMPEGPSPRLRLVVFGLSTVLLTGAIAAAVAAPGAPYNLRELFGNGPPLLSALGLALGLLVLGAGAGHAGRAMVSGRTPLRTLIGHAILTVAANFLFVRLAVSKESIYDIVGSPIWSRALSADPALAAAVDFAEVFVRYVALVGPLVLTLIVIVASIEKSFERGSGNRVTFGIALVILVTPLLYLFRLLVVPFAATDNLTELIAGSSNPVLGGEAFLYLVEAVIALHAAAILYAAVIRGRWLVRGLLITILAPVASWFFLNWGLSPSVEKYGIEFSAIQFLLGPDRQAALPQQQLILRWLVLHMALVGVLAAGLAAGRPARPARPRR